MSLQTAAEVQQASLFFFVPVTVAYLTACGGWLALARMQMLRTLWNEQPFPSTDCRWLDLAIGLLAAFGVLALGQAYRAGWLLPHTGSYVVQRLLWVADNLIIYAPIFLVLVARRQSARTILLPTARLGTRVGVGVVLGLLSVVLFLTMRGELGRLPGILKSAVDFKRLTDFVPVFLEGVALAFVLVRMRWVTGRAVTVLVPAVLFAAAHIPSGLAEGKSAVEIAAFFVLNVALVAVILDVVQRAQDIVWLSFVHYLMDIAIKAI